MCITKLILIQSMKFYCRLNYYCHSPLTLAKVTLNYQIPLVSNHHWKNFHIKSYQLPLSPTTTNQFKIRAVNTINRRNQTVTINHRLQQLATKQLTSQSNQLTTNTTNSIPTIVRTGQGSRHSDFIDSIIPISDSQRYCN